MIVGGVWRPKLAWVSLSLWRGAGRKYCFEEGDGSHTRGLDGGFGLVKDFLGGNAQICLLEGKLVEAPAGGTGS